VKFCIIALVAVRVTVPVEDEVAEAAIKLLAFMFLLASQPAHEVAVGVVVTAFTPVPPYSTPTSDPSHTPVVTVPIVARLAADVSPLRVARVLFEVAAIDVAIPVEVTSPVKLPVKVAAVPDVLAALLGISPETKAPQVGAVAALETPAEVRNSRVVVVLPASLVGAPLTPPYRTSPRVVAMVLYRVLSTVEFRAF
jgi:hypothetical protein